MNTPQSTRTPTHPAGGTLQSFSACAIIVLMVLFWSCKDSITDGPPDIVFPDSNISYNGLIQPLFDKTCAFSGGCHAGEDPASSLGLESYQRLTERLGIVTPGDPDNSLLYLRIKKDGLTPRMPLYRPPLTDNQVNGIAQWIREGAINN